MESLNPFGRTWLWHPTGAKVEVPLPSEPQAMFKAVNDYLAAGFTVEAPENAMKVEKLDVAFVVRFQKMNKHNRLQDNLYFYREHGEMGSDMTVYLNSDSDVAKFEEHSGLTVSSLPIYEGDAAPQRTGMQFPKFATPCKFTITREKEAPSAKYATGRWVLIDYVDNRNSSFNAVSSAPDGNHTSDSKIQSTPQNSGNSGTSKTPPQLKAEQSSLAENMPIDFSKNPPPNNAHDGTQWELWLKRQYTIYKKVRAS